MADLLDNFYYDTYNHSSLILSDRIDCDDSGDYDDIKEPFKFADHDDNKETNANWGESWFFNQFPELRTLPIGWEFHNLLFHSNYALQDIIRVNDFWCEAKVGWQHIAGQ